MANTIINTRSLVKSFSNNFALDGLNLQIPRGISGFIGRNGAGKTTTIGVLLGLLKADSGEATVFGLNCWQDSYEIKRRLGVMHEVNAYPRNFTGKQLLKHVARFYELSHVEQQVKHALTNVGLANAGGKKIGAYSAGMLKRLGLAQALIGDPELAVLDEPTANIDPLGRITLLERIKDMHKEQGTNFLISTHILSDLEKVCDWLSIIDAGKIVDQGEIKKLAEKYSANVYKIEVSNLRIFVDKIQELNIVDNVWIEDNAVFCKVSNVDLFCEETPKIVSELKLQLKNFQQIICTLEEIYKETAGAK